MSNNIFPQEAIDLFDSAFKDGDVESSWAVEVNGRRIKTDNGKSLWKKKGHAKAAITNMLKYKKFSARYYQTGRFHNLAYDCDTLAGNIFKMLEGRDAVIGERKDLDILYKSFISEMEDRGILKFIEFKHDED